MGFGTKPDNKPVASIPTVTGDTPSVSPANDAPLVNPDEKLAKKLYVQDTFHNKVGVNAGRFPNIIYDLKGFAEGSEITCVYYKEHYSESDVKGRYHTEEALHDAHKSVLKIVDFRMKLTQPLQYSHESDDNISKLVGEAFTYPGFHPEIGDKITMDIGDGKYGLFEVIQPPSRTSIRASTYFKISFSFIAWMDEDVAKNLDDSVVDVAYFDKMRFLSEPGALLIHDEVVELKYFEKQRAKMVHYFQAKFLDAKIMYSYMRPDTVYDPYVVDFMMKILNFGELDTAVLQLYQNAPFLDTSIWRALLDSNIPLESVPTAASKLKFILGSKSVLANSLTNKDYIEFVKSTSLSEYLDSILNKDDGEDSGSGEGVSGDSSIPPMPDDPDSDEILGDLMLHIHPHYCECPYVNGETEDSGTTDALSSILGEGDHFDLLSKFLMTRQIDSLNKLHTLIDNVWKLSPMEQFYKMPIYIFLAGIVKDYIHHGNCGMFDFH